MSINRIPPNSPQFPVDPFNSKSVEKTPADKISNKDKGHVTTLAIGEEGQDAGKPPSMRGKRRRLGNMTTLAIGEEGQDGGFPKPGHGRSPKPGKPRIK